MPVNIDRIIHSKRRTLALIVERDGSVTVRAPMRISGKAIHGFAEKHASWIEKKQAEMKSMAPEQVRQYQPGERFLYLGKVYPLEIVKDAKKNLVLEETFKLAEPAQKNAELLFRNWYRKQAKRIIEARVKFFAERYQLQYGKIRITSARTRWGSCSSKGTLSFSWRLVTTPPEVIDYVVIHELAHTVHHNHSKRFWNLVEKLLPDFKEHRKRVRQYGQESI